MKVILDSNILYSDPMLTGAKIKALCDSASKLGYSVCIPKVVAEEVENTFRENLAKAIGKINKELSDLERLTGRKLTDDIERNFIDEEALKQSKKFYTQLKVLKILLLDYPKIKHDQLAQKAIRKKKPFNESGNGYRDALIWENVKIVLLKPGLVSGTDVVLITNNHRDFSECGELHSHLKDELISSGYKIDAVKICATLENFIQEYIKPTVEFLDGFKLQLADTRKDVGKKYYHSISNQIFDFLHYREFDEDETLFGPDLESPTVDVIHEDYQFTVKEVLQLSSNEIFITAEVKVSCTFDVYIYKSTYYSMDDKKDIRVFDTDWNSQYVAANIERPVIIDVDAIYNHSTEEFSAVDLNI